MIRLVQPACRAARQGVIVNSFQGYIFDIVRPIYEASEPARRVYGSDLTSTGETLRQPELAATIEQIAREGPRVFYEGEIGRQLATLCEQEGGHLTREDLRGYQVHAREPLRFEYRNRRILTNPPPSAGGPLIQYALTLLAGANLDNMRRGGKSHLQLLTRVMALTNDARPDVLTSGATPNARLQADQTALSRWQVARGTTQISIVDRHHDTAAMTLSNGEGCGWLLPGTGSMLNNMLGETDINPQGIGQWPAGSRLGSMMAPTLIEGEGSGFALGSGGSNRIRSAILQVISNLLDFGLSPDDAVAAARVHLEDGLVSMEAGFARDAVESLDANYRLHEWQERNLFFGGVHLAGHTPDGFVASGDPRRGGYGLVVR
jgi:gamma-glutamyltranspeptidase/glutathione hydrolase